MRSRLPLVVTSILVACIIIALLEATSHVILNKIYNRKFDSSLIADSMFLTSPGLKHSAHGVVWGKNFATDEFGCRKTVKAYSPKKRKWLFIGDSVTEGVGVDDSLTFASLYFGHSDSLNIMNYSLIGYSVTDYLNVLKCLVSQHDSSIQRVTLFFCLNDVYGSVKTKELPAMQRRGLISMLSGFLQKHSALYGLLKLWGFRNADNYFKYDLQFYKPGNPYFSQAMATLSLCDSVCKSAGAYMNVVVLPYRSQLAGVDENNAMPQNLIGNYCVERKINFSDPLPFLKNAGSTGGLYIFADEIHFSEKGHRAMADYLLSH